MGLTKIRRLCILLLAILGILAPLGAHSDNGAALFSAIEDGDLQKAKQALAANRSPNLNQTGYGTLLQVAIDGEHIEIVRILIESGADVNKVSDDDKRFPLHIAVDTGNVDITRLLLASGALVNAVDDRGQSALFLAIQNSDLTVLRELVGRDADLNLADSAGTTPLTATIVAKPNLATFLLKSGVKIDGEKIAEMTACRACHGSKGRGSTVNTSPYLGGQHAEYLAKQLRDYQSKMRIDIRMNKYVKAMTEEVIHELAAYYSNQNRGGLRRASNPAAPADGASLYSQREEGGKSTSCASCHGDDGSSPSNKFTPIIAGMDAQYVEIQLKNFRDGKRSNDVDGVMRAAVNGWSDEKISSVSKYIESLE